MNVKLTYYIAGDKKDIQFFSTILLNVKFDLIRTAVTPMNMHYTDKLGLLSNYTLFARLNPTDALDSAISRPLKAVWTHAWSKMQYELAYEWSCCLTHVMKHCRKNRCSFVHLATHASNFFTQLIRVVLKLTNIAVFQLHMYLHCMNWLSVTVYKTNKPWIHFFIQYLQHSTQKQYCKVKPGDKYCCVPAWKRWLRRFQQTNSPIEKRDNFIY